MDDTPIPGFRYLVTNPERLGGKPGNQHGVKPSAGHRQGDASTRATVAPRTLWRACVQRHSETQSWEGSTGGFQ